MRRTPSEVVDRLVALKSCVVFALGAPPREVVAQLRTHASVKEREAMEDKAEEARYAYWNPIEATDVFDAMTDAEKTLGESTIMSMTLDQQAEAVAWLEGVAVLAWATGIIEEMPPYDRAASREILQRVPAPQSLATARADATLRSDEDLEGARTVAQLWAERARLYDLAANGFTLPEDLQQEGVKSLDDVVRVTTAHAVMDGAIGSPIEGDFPVRGGPYRKIEEPVAMELQTIAQERLRALRWLTGDQPRWDEG